MQKRSIGNKNLYQFTHYRGLLVFLFSAAILMIAGGCLWDRDTLRDERFRFPGVLELIAGKFPRHSTSFYQWRIRDRLSRLEKTPDDLSLLDDLAVAYDKTGASADAIAVGLKMLERAPERYETLANLGTFYLHAGQFDKGLPLIEKAIAINPNAHFGREKIQLLLVKYVLSKQIDGQTQLPLAAGGKTASFAHFFMASTNDNASVKSNYFDADDLEEALVGVKGMMRFSKHDSPILLEALGDLLSGPNSPRDDARLLAVRAYLSASYAVQDETARAAYRKLATETLANGSAGSPDNHYPPYKDLTLDTVEMQFKKELDEGAMWYHELEKNETQWIETGDDVEGRFDAVYRKEPQIEIYSKHENPTNPAMVLATASWRSVLGIVVIFCAMMMLVGIGAYAVIRIKLLNRKSMR